MTDRLIQELTESFIRFPGIGPRQGRRFVYYLLHLPRGAVEHLLKQIEELKQSASQCPSCFRFYASASERKSKLCTICEDDNRDAALLMLVEKDIDLENVLKSGTYQGHFFVLGGLVKILDREPEASIRGKELLALIVKRAKTGELKEIITALAANEEGDGTVEFLKKYLAALLTQYQLKFTTLGRGLSTGVELEYSDAETLKNALKHRESR